jgi:hypothetical protein
MAADLPVRQVVLYKHGVGYFARAGQLAPGESARLEFKAAEMDDVLKSLTIDEKGGGKINGLRYDSSEPLMHKLAGFPFQIAAGQPLSALLDQFRGAAIQLQFASESVAGKIVTARLIAGDDKRPEREQITLLMDSGDLRNFDLSAVAGMHFAEARLEAQFKDYLTALSDARSSEKRSIYIDSTGGKAREISASYMVPMPIWKSSYRLIFTEAAGPMLEGWAIVDNTTDEDWKDVDLSLVSGRPISFTSKLYEPRYVTRPAAELPEDRAVAPRVFEGAMASAPPPPPAMAKAAPLPQNGRNFLQLSMLEPKTSAIAAVAGASEIGELFEYHIATPVTIRRNESAMLPFLQQKVEARKLIVYTDDSSAHPMNAAEIVNSTGKTLDGGPITVYDAGAYAGEALIETLKSADKRLIAYGVDLGTRITTKLDSSSDLVRELHARRGMLHVRMAAVDTITYTIHNVDQKAKTLIIEHTVRPEYKLVNRQPSEKTSSAYRFEVHLAAGGNETFPVTEERVYEDEVTVSDATPDVLIDYLSNKILSEAGRKQLEQIAHLKQQGTEASRDMERLERESNDLIHEEERLRQNIASLNQVSGQQQQVQSYAQQLAANETKLAALRDRRAEADRKRAGLEAQVSVAMETLAF